MNDDGILYLPFLSFQNGEIDATEFLSALARRFGKLLKGGEPDLVSLDLDV